ncbi:hypothetical protein F383_28507 [Gossypium arboreum]|uniref:Uncharacterized protein n=1 Tax=Gossypium arboreum TaxID=29729 RepID=A0A0B0PDM0_GOSAR|nr:hypothetical protein F383_28507 [Gossypium arboreum]
MVLHVNHKLMPTSQTWSYTKIHIRSYVTVDASINLHIHLPKPFIPFQ